MEINLLNDFYLPLQKQEELYSSKEYQLLKKNNVDTAKLEGLEPDKNAGLIEFGEGNQDQAKQLFNDVIDYAASIPKDLLISGVRGTMNGFDFLKDIAAAATYGNTELPEDSIFKFIDEKIEKQKQNLNTLEEDDPLTTRMIGAIGQDAAYVYPIYKKFQSIGVPKSYALPVSFALGSTLAFDKKTSMFLDTDTINGFKKAIDIDDNTPAEELFDKLVQFVEFSGMGFAFNKLAPMFKAIKKSNQQQNAVAVGGSAAAGEGADKISDNIQNNIISQQTEKE